MSKQSTLSKFLLQVHGKRLITRGLHNTTAYYNLKGKGLMKADCYGNVTFYPRHNPDSYTLQMYFGQFDTSTEGQINYAAV